MNQAGQQSDAQITVGMASFARYYSATHSARVRAVRDLRSRYTDPQGYAGRNYYNDFLNTVRTVHWQRGDFAALPNALLRLQGSISVPVRREHYEIVSNAYLSGWTSRNARPFFVPRGHTVIEGVKITISPEIGMSFKGGDFVLKLWLNGQKPTKQYREVLDYLVSTARPAAWKAAWKFAMWDVRRDIILPPAKIPRDMELSVISAAVGLRRTWETLNRQAQRVADGSNEEGDDIAD